MKLILFLLVMISISSVLFAENIPIMIGIDAGYTPNWLNSYIGENLPGLNYNSLTSQELNYLDLGLYADCKYLRVDLSYQVSLGNQNNYESTNGIKVINYITNYSQQNINVQVLGKYPFDLSERVSIWPALGFEFSSSLYAGYNGTNMLTNSGNQNTFYIKVGAGSDIKITRNLYIQPLILFGFNQLAMDDVATISLGYATIDFKIGLAYKF